MPRFEKIPRENWPRAREMRKYPTRAEQILWKALRSGQLGKKFRRQHPVGHYIADFFAYRSKLVVELDGDPHGNPDRADHDRARDAYFESCGFRVKRYANHDVLTNLSGVLRDILDALEQQPD
jgi:very-short-patch-repair endonuclease